MRNPLSTSIPQQLGRTRKKLSRTVCFEQLNEYLRNFFAMTSDNVFVRSNDAL
jgi:hypothetical protein